MVCTQDFLDFRQLCRRERIDKDESLGTFVTCLVIFHHGHGHGHGHGHIFGGITIGRAFVSSSHALLREFFCFDHIHLFGLPSHDAGRRINRAVTCNGMLDLDVLAVLQRV